MKTTSLALSAFVLLSVLASEARADEPVPPAPGAAPEPASPAPAVPVIVDPALAPPPTTPTPVVMAPTPAAPDLTVPAPAYAPIEERKVAWKPHWTKFTTADYLLTGGLLLGTGAFILFGNPEAGPNWRGPILFDGGVRDAVRERTPTGRKTAQHVGDAFYYGGLAYPYLVDVVAVSLVGHRAPEVAGQMALINTEAFAITGFLSFLSNATIRRERPYATECPSPADPDRPDPGFPGCGKGGASEGFFSGHTAIAFTGAGLTCMHHANLPLYGKSGVGGVIACASTMAGATAGGVLRLSADKHYVSDVIVGAGIGLASGLIVPWLHYRSAAKPAASSKAASPVRWLPAPMVSPSTAGVAAFGTF